MTGNLITIPEPTSAIKTAPMRLYVHLDGCTEPVFTTARAGTIVLIEHPSGDPSLALDISNIDWHYLFHLALGKLAAERAASTDTLLARFREAS